MNVIFYHIIYQEIRCCSIWYKILVNQISC